MLGIWNKFVYLKAKMYNWCKQDFISKWKLKKKLCASPRLLKKNFIGVKLLYCRDYIKWRPDVIIFFLLIRFGKCYNVVYSIISSYF